MSRKNEWKQSHEPKDWRHLIRFRFGRVWWWMGPEGRVATPKEAKRFASALHATRMLEDWCWRVGLTHEAGPVEIQTYLLPRA